MSSPQDTCPVDQRCNRRFMRPTLKKVFGLQIVPLLCRVCLALICTNYVLIMKTGCCNGPLILGEAQWGKIGKYVGENFILLTLSNKLHWNVVFMFVFMFLFFAIFCTAHYILVYSDHLIILYFHSYVTRVSSFQNSSDKRTDCVTNAWFSCRKKTVVMYSRKAMVASPTGNMPT